MRVLIAGVGYRNLRDLSAGPMAVDRLSERSLPAGVVVRDYSDAPVTVVQTLEAETGYNRAIFIASVVRHREPGGLYVYLWDKKLPDAEAIEARMLEAVNGIISLDNLLVIAEHFGVLPPEVIVIELEPVESGLGEEMTPALEPAFERALDDALDLAAARPGHIMAPVAPLGGPTPVRGTIG